jgi:hypothetical protein
MSATRDQIISFLLQSNDSCEAIIADLKTKLSVLEKQLADSTTKEKAEQPV